MLLFIIRIVPAHSSRGQPYQLMADNQEQKRVPEHFGSHRESLTKQIKKLSRKHGRDKEFEQTCTLFKEFIVDINQSFVECGQIENKNTRSQPSSFPPKSNNSTSDSTKTTPPPNNNNQSATHNQQKHPTNAVHNTIVENRIYNQSAVTKLTPVSTVSVTSQPAQQSSISVPLAINPPQQQGFQVHTNLSKASGFSHSMLFPQNGNSITAKKPSDNQNSNGHQKQGFLFAPVQTPSNTFTFQTAQGSLTKNIVLRDQPIDPRQVSSITVLTTDPNDGTSISKKQVAVPAQPPSNLAPTIVIPRIPSNFPRTQIIIAPPANQSSRPRTGFTLVEQPTVQSNTATRPTSSFQPVQLQGFTAVQPPNYPTSIVIPPPVPSPVSPGVFQQLRLKKKLNLPEYKKGCSVQEIFREQYDVLFNYSLTADGTVLEPPPNLHQ